jgi:hypothetical protein
MDMNKDKLFNSLLCAVKAGDEKTAIELVQSGVSPVSDDPEVSTKDSPIHVACEEAMRKTLSKI